MRRITPLLLLLAFAGACKKNNKIPDGILKPDKMQAVLWDVIKADAYTTTFIKKDSSKNAANENQQLQQEIFAIHKITKADFYNSYEYYKTKPAVFKKLMDSMIAQEERKKTYGTKTFTNKPLQTE